MSTWIWCLAHTAGGHERELHRQCHHAERGQRGAAAVRRVTEAAGRRVHQRPGVLSLPRGSGSSSGGTLPRVCRLPPASPSTSSASGWLLALAKQLGGHACSCCMHSVAKVQRLWRPARDAAAGMLQVYYPVITASSQLDPSLVANLTGPNTTVRHCAARCAKQPRRNTAHENAAHEARLLRGT